MNIKNISKEQVSNKLFHLAEEFGIVSDKEEMESFNNWMNDNIENNEKEYYSSDELMQLCDRFAIENGLVSDKEDCEKFDEWFVRNFNQ